MLSGQHIHRECATPEDRQVYRCALIDRYHQHGRLQRHRHGGRGDDAMGASSAVEITVTVAPPPRKAHRYRADKGSAAARTSRLARLVVMPFLFLNINRAGGCRLAAD